MHEEKLLKSTSGRGGEGDIHSEEPWNMRRKSSTDFVLVHKKAIKKLIHSYVWEKKVQLSQLRVVDASQPSVNKL